MGGRAVSYLPPVVHTRPDPSGRGRRSHGVHFLSVYFFSVYTRSTPVDLGRLCLPIFGGGNAILSCDEMLKDGCRACLSRVAISALVVFFFLGCARCLGVSDPCPPRPTYSLSSSLMSATKKDKSTQMVMNEHFFWWGGPPRNPIFFILEC